MNINKLDKKILNETQAKQIKQSNYKLNFKIYDRINSTNNKAKEFINDFEAEIDYNNMHIIAADQQSAGRGRKGNNWFSDNNASLSTTFLIKTAEDINKIPQITAAAALAVADSLGYFSLKNRIKWPNDILIKNKKIAGILSELVIKNKEAFIIIGCGINLNNENFNSKISEFATSYYLEKDKKINKNLFLKELTKNMDYYIKSFLSKRRNDIIKKWKQKLNLKNKKIDIVYKEKNYTVIIKDILMTGELLVELSNGKELSLQSANTSLDYSSLEKYKQN